MSESSYRSIRTVTWLLTAPALGLWGCSAMPASTSNGNENALGTGTESDVGPTQPNPDQPPSALEVSIEGRGRVDPIWSGGRYVIRAIPEQGWRFDGWFGTVMGSQNPIFVTPGDSVSIGARFVPDDAPSPE